MREPNPEETFSYVISKIKENYPQLAFVHLVEPPAREGNDARKSAEQHEQEESNEFIRKIWQPLPLIVTGDFQPETAKRTVDEKDGLVAFGRWFISNVSHGRPMCLDNCLTAIRSQICRRGYETALSLRRMTGKRSILQRAPKDTSTTHLRIIGYLGDIEKPGL